MSEQNKDSKGNPLANEFKAWDRASDEALYNTEEAMTNPANPQKEGHDCKPHMDSYSLCWICQNAIIAKAELAGKMAESIREQLTPWNTDEKCQCGQCTLVKLLTEFDVLTDKEGKK